MTLGQVLLIEAQVAVPGQSNHPFPNRAWETPPDSNHQSAGWSVPSHVPSFIRDGIAEQLDRVTFPEDPHLFAQALTLAYGVDPSTGRAGYPFSQYSANISHYIAAYAYTYSGAYISISDSAVQGSSTLSQRYTQYELQYLVGDQ